MKEPPTFRYELEQILKRYPAIMTVTDVAEYTGRSRRWCREHLKISGDTTAVNLAMKLSKLGG